MVRCRQSAQGRAPAPRGNSGLLSSLLITTIMAAPEASYEEKINGLRSRWDEFSTIFQKYHEPSTKTSAFSMLSFMKLQTVFWRTNTYSRMHQAAVEVCTSTHRERCTHSIHARVHAFLWQADSVLEIGCGAGGAGRFVLPSLSHAHLLTIALHSLTSLPNALHTTHQALLLKACCVTMRTSLWLTFHPA